MATPEEAYKRIIPLDFGSVQTVPDSFVWPQSSDGVQPGDGLTIPIIDLMDPNAPQLITEACETWGIFQLKGHGTATKLMEDMESECERLFSLPTDQKMKALRSPGGRMTGYGIAPIQSLFSTTMWHEGFTIMGSAIDHARLLWRNDYQGFCVHFFFTPKNFMATPSDQAYKHIIPLDFNSVKSLPGSFVWLESDVIPSCDGLSIPAIDLMDPNAPKLITQACETWGIFHLKGHGIPTELMEDVESEARKLFDLPIDQKLKAIRSPDGQSGYGIAPIQSLFSTFMWHEGFCILGSAIDQAKVLWLHDYQGFCDVMDDYQKQMKALAEKLMRILFKALNIPVEEVNWFDDPTNSSGCSLALQLNSYPPCPDPTRALGLAPHTDTSLVTLLQAKTNGLQVFKDGVGWFAVQPLHDPDALTVNLGDFTRILSNGRFISVLHRVVVKPIQRYSVAYFFRPPMDFDVSPLLSKDLSPGQVPRFRSVTVKEYSDLKAKHLDKAFSLIEN